MPTSSLCYDIISKKRIEDSLMGAIPWGFFAQKITTTLSSGRDCNVMPCRVVLYERFEQSSNDSEIFCEPKKLLCDCLNLGTYHQNTLLHHPAKCLQNQNGGGKSDIAVDYIHLLYLHNPILKAGIQLWHFIFYHTFFPKARY